MDSIKKRIIKVYLDSLNRNFADINEILTDFNVDKKKLLPIYNNLLKKSSNNIVNKWLAQSKYIRTSFVLKAFSEAYPLEAFRMSVMIDAMVNMLDDLLDEKLSQEAKTMYILEYLRVFSNYSFFHPDRYILDVLGKYFNQLITLAIAEFEYLKNISKEKDKTKIIELSFKLLSLRSQDIDPFVLIPIHFNKRVKEEIAIKRFRIFRAVNILKKDIVDEKHDITNGQLTLVTYMRKRKDYRFKDYIKDLTDRFRIEQERIFDKNYKNGEIIFQRLNKMLEEELLKINRLVS